MFNFKWCLKKLQSVCALQPNANRSLKILEQPLQARQPWLLRPEVSGTGFSPRGLELFFKEAEETGDA